MQYRRITTIKQFVRRNRRFDTAPNDTRWNEERGHETTTTRGGEITISLYYFIRSWKTNRDRRALQRRADGLLMVWRIHNHMRLPVWKNRRFHDDITDDSEHKIPSSAISPRPFVHTLSEDHGDDRRVRGRGFNPWSDTGTSRSDVLSISWLYKLLNVYVARSSCARFRRTRDGLGERAKFVRGSTETGGEGTRGRHLSVYENSVHLHRIHPKSKRLC